MKLQCSCGAKYAFDATPDMLNNPVKFICPSCGLDASDFVNDLIRQEFGAETAPAAPPAPAVSPQLKISHDAPPAAAPAAAPTVSKYCSKHRELATAKCTVCHKPICPRCLELFGYFCSPLCKGKAEAQNIQAPVYAGQRDVVESIFWRKAGLIGGSLGALVVLFVAAWIWYAWFGSVPHPYFSVRFADDDRGYFGDSQLVGPDQIVFLHGGTLARYDLKSGKPVWSQELISKTQLDQALTLANQEEDRINAAADVGYHHRRPSGEIERSVKQELQAGLRLFVSGQNVWVARRGTLTQYDWNTGTAGKTVSVFRSDGLVAQGDDLEVFSPDSVTHVNLATGDSHTDQIAGGGAGGAPAVLGQTGGAGLPGTGTGTGRLDPQKVAAQAQNLNVQGRIALPALLSNARHEQDLENALKDDSQRPQTKDAAPALMGEVSQLVPGETGFALFSERLLEQKLVPREAMKAPPKKSVLDGDLNASQTHAVANEILNEMQRNASGGMVMEDQSRYQVTVHLPDAPGTPDWTGEVTGPPQLFVLKTVNVIAAGKSLIVLDKANKQLWQVSLTYPVSRLDPLREREKSPYGEGPCVERGDTLYVFDQAVLSAFDLRSGNARWRLPSVGVLGLFFDDHGDLYVNTTTGNPDDIRYSLQIDVTRTTEAMVYKLDPKTGRTLWSVKGEGFVCYLSGRFIYTIEAYDPNPTDEEAQNDMTAALQKPAYLSIARLQPSDGRILWEYVDHDRSPVHARFDHNSIELIFKREVQVLRYLTL